MNWDPGVYLRFADHRVRPAMELLSRVSPAGAVRRIVDLGCGTGELVPALIERFPDASVVAVDNSTTMLAEARANVTDPLVSWVEADAATWEPDRDVDLIFSNALLHWLDDHAALLPRMLSWLRPRGVLGLQMPRNFDAPSHTWAYEVAQDPRWHERLTPLLRRQPVADPGWYARLLAPHTSELDVWETEYQQILAGDDPVVGWSSGTLLRPLLARLSAREQSEFLAAYAEGVRRAYPTLEDGRTIFPFRRLFIVARV